MLKRNRVIASIVTAAIIFTVMPMAVFAEGKTGEEPNGVNYTAPENVDVITELIPGSFEDYIIDAGDKDALFESYAGRLFYGSGTPRLRGIKATGDRLEDQNKTIYNYIKSAAAEIAAGLRGSAVIEIPLEELGVDPDKLYTAEDLGLDYIYDGNTGTWNGGVSSAMMSMFDFDSSLIMNTLYADCPYELYWARSMSFPVILQIRLSATYSNGVYTGYASFNEPFTVRVSVESKYQDSSDPEGYTADSGKTGEAAAAASYAMTIIAEAAGMSDYEKLAYYKDKICELVVYDEYARDHSNTMEDRGPWALIYVFDQDDSTNVVCEGYSEAFQYLCDNTDFDNDEICVYSVTGNMGGGTGGGGGHKWNIVHMDDGYNYIADITNSDEGSWGENGELFLSGMNGSCSSGYQKHVDEWTEEEDLGNGTVVYTTHPEKSIQFVYDDITKTIFTEDELTLSSIDYAESISIETDDVARLEGISLFLTDKIGFRVHVLIDTDYVNDNDCMIFEYEGNTVSQRVGDALTDTEASLDDNQKMVIFELPLTATQMTVPVTFHMVVRNRSGEEMTYSVKSYAAQILEEGSGYSDNTKQLVEAMLHYGAFAQLYMGLYTDDLANEGYEFIWEENDLYDLADYQYELINNSGSNIKLSSSSLALETDLSVRFYFDKNEGYEWEDFDITATDPEGNPVSYSTEYDNGRYYIIVRNISPLNLGNMIRLTITDNGTQAVDLTYGPLSYCYAKATGSGSAGIRNLCKAIFKYYLAACVYEQA